MEIVFSSRALFEIMNVLKIVQCALRIIVHVLCLVLLVDWVFISNKIRSVFSTDILHGYSGKLEKPAPPPNNHGVVCVLIFNVITFPNYEHFLLPENKFCQLSNKEKKL